MLSRLPSVDETVSYILHLSPLPASIIGLLFIVWILKGWYESIKEAAERGRAIAHHTRRAFAHVRTMSAGAIGIASAASLLTLIAQGLWLVASFLIGSMLSGVVGANPNLAKIPQNTPTLTQYREILHWNSVSAGYVLFSLAVIIRAYVLAMRGDDANGWTYLFGLPAYLFGFLEIAGGVIAVSWNLINFISHKPPPAIIMNHQAVAITWKFAIFGIIAGIVGLLYWHACRLVFRAPLWLIEMWGGPSA